MIHDELKADGIHVGQLIIPGAIVAGHDRKDPKVLADTLWEMHTNHGEFRVFADDLDA